MSGGAVLFALLLIHGAIAQPPTCVVNRSFTCFADSPARPVTYLAVSASRTLDVDLCVSACVVNGFTVIAITSNPSSAFCYCGATVAPNAQVVPNSRCSLACPGDARDNCGGVNVSAVYDVSCAGPLPPSPVGPPSIAPGRACSQSEVRGLPFCDTNLPRDARVADLVDRLTLPEIASQLQARSSAAIPRFGIGPFYWGSNQIHGIAGAHCQETGRCPVSWPDGVAMTASFNETAWRLLGAVAGIELRAFYNIVEANSSNPGLGLTSWGPTINLIRDGRWGRAQESASEDPFVSGKYGAQVSAGLQSGADPRFLLAVSGLKHFAAYSLEQYGPPSDPAQFTRQTFNAAVTRFDAGDSYFRPFEMAIKQGGAAGVMYAANEFQLYDPSTDPTPSPMTGGVPCCLSTSMRDVLASWNFTGYRCTDGGQIEQAVALHKYVPTLDQAIGLAAAALSDIADGDEYATGLAHAWLNGNVSLSQAKRLVSNALAIRFRLGLFDPPEDQPYEKFGAADIGTPEHWAAAALASREALILLKNNASALPLTPGAAWARAGSLAVIGPAANDTLTLQGNYGGSFCPAGPHGPVTTCFPSIFSALQQTHAPGAVYAQGSLINASDDSLLAAAVAAARAADVVVAVLGLDQSLEREQLDRFNMSLPAAQEELFAALFGVVAETGARLVVVLVHGGALAIPEVKAGASAIVDALYAGVTAGAAVADALFGVFSPGGKLPYTVYDRDYQSMYNFTNMSIAEPQNYTDAVSGEARTSPGGRTYRYFKGNVLWPFGFGLSYNTWTLGWSAAPANNSSVDPLGNVSFAVSLTNEGAVQGDEVVELFVEPDASSLSPLPPFVPLQSMVGFARRSLAPGATATIQFTLAAADAFAVTAADGTRAVPSGARFTVRVCLGPLRGGDLIFDVVMS